MSRSVLASVTLLACVSAACGGTVSGWSVPTRDASEQRGRSDAGGASDVVAADDGKATLADARLDTVGRDVQPALPKPDASPTAPTPAPQCAPGSVDNGSCGACRTGRRARTCDQSGRWGLWSPCSGEQRGFPLDPTTGMPVCPPYRFPAVFFSPHPDDETLFMGGAIREHVAAGRQVFIELMTHGRASGVLTRLNTAGSTCPWHSGTHGLSLSRNDLGNGRLAEFRDAARRLGVAGIVISDFGDGNLTVAEVGQRVRWWLAHRDAGHPKGVSLKGTAVKAGFTYQHPDHKAVWDALVASRHDDVRGYGYAAADGTPARTIGLSTTLCAAKMSAWAAYKRWEPARQRYAIGAHSVGPDAATCTEYVWLP